MEDVHVRIHPNLQTAFNLTLRRQFSLSKLIYFCLLHLIIQYQESNPLTYHLVRRIVSRKDCDLSFHVMVRLIRLSRPTIYPHWRFSKIILKQDKHHYSYNKSHHTQVVVQEEVCVNCHNNKAELHQVNGSYCLDCWQCLTHPDV